MASLLVLTGVSNLEDVERYKKRSGPDDKFNIPDYYCNDLKEFGEFIS
jgi:ribonucleotide monophosphatase NagD (HAD superfamily)